jgi:hypothetical protein
MPTTTGSRVAFLILGCAPPILASAQDTYYCIDYSGPTGATGSGEFFHLNNSGLVAADFNYLAYTFTPTTGWTPLPAAPSISTPADPYTPSPVAAGSPTVPNPYAVGINDSGTVVGGVYVAAWASTYWGYEEGFIYNSSTGYTIPPTWVVGADPSVFTANPGFVSYFDVEFEGVGNNGLIGGEAFDPNVSTDTAGIGFVYNPTASAIGIFPPGYTTIQPTLSDGSKPASGSGFSIVWDFNTQGWFVGGGLSSTQQREAIVYKPASAGSAGLQAYLLSLPDAVIMARAINDEDPDSANNCPTATDTCFRTAGWTAPWIAGTTPTWSWSGNYVGYYADFDPANGEFQEPQQVNCSQQIPNAVNWQFTGINNSNVISGTWFDSGGVDHPLLAYPNLGTPSSITPAGAFVFSFTVQSAVTTYFIDPPIAVGYHYAIGKGNPSFSSVTLPILGQGSNKYTLLTHDHEFTVSAGQKFDFTKEGFESGVESFRVLAIDPANALNPSNTTAFVTGVTFTGTGEFTGTMAPLTASKEISELERAANRDGNVLEEAIKAVAKDEAAGNTAATCNALGKFVADVATYSFRLGPHRVDDLTAQALAIENAVGCP